MSKFAPLGLRCYCIANAVRDGKVSREIINAAIRGQLSQEDTRLLCMDHPEVIGLALLAAGHRLAQQNDQLAQAENAAGLSPSTPSGMMPSLRLIRIHQRGYHGRVG